jgi:hypothetical protein
MKLSHDKSSWHAGGLVARDSRAVKEPEDDRPVGKPRKKNAKRWCKGQEGREHQIVWVRYNKIHNNANLPDNWLIQRCSKCHKTFEYCRSQMGKSKCQVHQIRHEVVE